MTGVYAELMELAEKIDSEASISARPGQMDRLEKIAHRLRELAEPGPSSMVREFHVAFGVAVAGADTPALRALRQSLINEEAREVGEALGWEKPLEDVAKELADLVYVAYGTAVSLGIDLDEAVRRVHASNMSKRNLDGSVSYRDDGKVLKPATYSAPDMTGVAPGLA